MYEYLATLTAGRAHGTAFEYRSCETDILGWVCERATGVRMPELLSSLIWSRLGAEQDMDAAVDPAGAVFHDGGLAATLRDLGRFGQMLLDGGAAGGQQVLPGSWIADSIAGAADTRDVFAASDNGLAARRWLPQPVLAAPPGPGSAAVPGHSRPADLGRAGPAAGGRQAVVLAAAAGPADD